MIAWKPGLERSPDGNRVREIPTRHTWSSTLHISKDGVAWRRFFNPITQVWNWAEKPQNYALGVDNTRLGISILDQWVPLSTAVCLAWKHRLPGSPTKSILEQGFTIHTDHLRWTEPGSNKEQGVIEDEIWSPLKYRCGIRNCPQSYKISNRGRIKSPTGQITSGFYALDTMWAAVKGAGLVDLLLACGNKPNAPQLRPYQSLTVNCIMTGNTPKDLSSDCAIALSTAWSYFTQCAVFIQASDLQRIGPNLISRDVWSILHILQSENEPLLGGTLKELLPIVESRLSSDSEFIASPFKLSELRFARLCIESTCSSLKVCGRS